MIPFPDKKYNIIYADPPWSYHLWNKSKSVGVHGRIRMASAFYDTMTTEEIKQLPIQDISDDNSALIMWVTNPLLPEGLEVIKYWGFKYKTVLFSWVKTYSSGKIWVGMGNYTRSGMELCLLAMKGTLKRYNHSIKQVQLSNIDKHSKKPDLFRQLIIQLFGDLPRIELFARQKIDGWDQWGDQVDIPK